MRQLFSRPQALAVTGGVPGDPDLHQLAADSAAGDRRRLHRHGGDADPPAEATTTAAAAQSKGRGGQETGRGTDRRLSGDRSDGNRNRRGPDPPGRSQARRRPVGTHPARPAKRGRRHGHHHAQGPHPRQHAAGTRTSIASKSPTCRWPTANVEAGHAAGDGFRPDHAARCAASPPASRPSTRRPCGSSRRSAIRPRCSATRSSSRPACWPRI